MTFLEFIGPEKALFYGVALGCIIGAVVTAWTAKPKTSPLPVLFLYPDDLRNIIAGEIWMYQELDKQFGLPFDGIDADGSGTPCFAKRMCIDEAERIRARIMGMV